MKNKLRFEAAIFDLDGTLLDSLRVWEQVDLAFLSRRGIPRDDEYMAAMASMTLPECADFTIQRFRLREAPESLVAEWKKLAYEAYAFQVPLKPGVREMLQSLRHEGIRLAAATAGDIHLLLPALKRCGVEELFDVLVTADEVGAGKHSPAIYIETARRMNRMPEQCVVFEDTLTGLRTAKKAGMLTVAVWDPAGRECREDLRQESDFFTEDFTGEIFAWMRDVPCV